MTDADESVARIAELGKRVGRRDGPVVIADASDTDVPETRIREGAAERLHHHFEFHLLQASDTVMNGPAARHAARGWKSGQSVDLWQAPPSMAPRAPAPPPRAAAPRGPLSVALRLALGLLALAIPVLAFWLAAAVALDAGAGRGTAIALGLGLVLGLPIAWDLWAEGRAARRDPPVERVLARSDRIRLRVLALSLGFGALMLFGLNRQMTQAIASRGDWFLDGSDTPFATDLRTGLAHMADDLGRTFGPRGEAAPHDAGPLAETTAAARVAPVIPEPAARARADWPLPSVPHPAVTGLTPTRARSFADVAAHIRAQEPDPRGRARAYHDFAIAHLSLDVQGLFTPPPAATQAADAVFAARRATPLGFANLVTALGTAAGDEVVTVTGRTRHFSTEHQVFEHAWNAVAVDGGWEFLDASKDAGVLIGHEFAPGHGTTWLFPPPELMAWDHLPDDPAWSVPGAPTTPDALLAGTALSAPAAIFGLSPTDAPTRLVASDADFALTLRNPRRASLLATAWSPDDGTSARCAPPTRAEVAELTCALGSARRWIVLLHATIVPEGPFVPVGQLRVLHRGASG